MKHFITKRIVAGKENLKKKRKYVRKILYFLKCMNLLFLKKKSNSIVLSSLVHFLSKLA